MRTDNQMKLDELLCRTLTLGPEVQVQDHDGPGTVLGWDSMGHMRLMAAIESTYRVKLEPQDMIQPNLKV